MRNAPFECPNDATSASRALLISAKAVSTAASKLSRFFCLYPCFVLHFFSLSFNPEHSSLNLIFDSVFAQEYGDATLQQARVRVRLRVRVWFRVMVWENDETKPGDRLRTPYSLEMAFFRPLEMSTQHLLEPIASRPSEFVVSLVLGLEMWVCLVSFHLP